MPHGADAAVARTYLRALEEAVADLPRVTLADEELRRLCHGQAISLPRFDGEIAAVFDATQRLVATAAWDAGAMVLRPDKVFRRGA